MHHAHMHWYIPYNYHILTLRFLPNMNTVHQFCYKLMCLNPSCHSHKVDSLALWHHQSTQTHRAHTALQLNYWCKQDTSQSINHRIQAQWCRYFHYSCNQCRELLGVTQNNHWNKCHKEDQNVPQDSGKKGVQSLLYTKCCVKMGNHRESATGFMQTDFAEVIVKQGQGWHIRLSLPLPESYMPSMQNWQCGPVELLAQF